MSGATAYYYQELIDINSAEPEQVEDTHGHLLLVKARTLKRLGDLDSAMRICNYLMKKQYLRSFELIKDILHEKALIEELLGHYSSSRMYMEKVHGYKPFNLDVAQRMGWKN